MIPKLAKLLVLFLSLLILSPVRAVFADTGPKPTMDFEFQQAMTGEPPVTILSGILYECDQADCSDAAPLEEAGPQRFTCEINSCHALAYGFAPYHRLEIEFSDGKIRRSDIFETAGFNSQYLVTIRPNDLLVQAQFSLSGFPRTAIILVACCCAIVGASLVVGLIVYLLRRPNKI